MNTEEIIKALNDIIFDVSKASDAAYKAWLSNDFENGLCDAEGSLDTTAEQLKNLIEEIQRKELSAKIHSK